MLILLGALGILAVAAWMALPFRFQLICIGICAPLQIFIGSLSLPIAACVLLLTAVTRVVRLRRANALLFLVAANCLVVLVVGVLHRSPFRDYVDAILYAAMLLASVVLGLTIDGAARNSLLSMLRAFLIVAAADAALVIYFRLQPAAEIAFFQSALARAVVNPNTLAALFAGSPNNALDPDKAGAFFVNANAGSAFLGACLLLSLVIARESRRPGRWSALAVLFGAGVVASGSKTGLIMLIVVGAWLLVSSNSKRSTFRLFLITVSPLALFWIIPVVSAEALSIGTATNTRGILWRQAAELIAQAPVLGSGFGAWEQWTARTSHLIGSSASYPPHNLLLSQWITSGAVGVAVLLGIWFFALRAAMSTIHARTLTVLVVWTIVQSLGDNTGIFLDNHLVGVLGIVLGAASTMQSNVQSETAPVLKVA
ncbi:O-antigen ligase family protein [Curtobacterium citreum]